MRGFQTPERQRGGSRALVNAAEREAVLKSQGGGTDPSLELASSLRLIALEPNLPNGYWGVAVSLVGLVWGSWMKRRDASRQAHPALADMHLDRRWTRVIEHLEREEGAGREWFKTRPSA